MIGTFALVTLQGFRNRVWQRIRRLRDPRYLIGGIAGIAYLWLMLFRRNGAVFRSHPPPEMTAVLTACLSVVVLCVLLVAWALPADSGGLQFSEAEIAFLFSAPIRRRDLLLYKTMRAQPQALISAALFSVFGWSHGHFIGIWLLFSVLSIYFTTISLARARLRLAGIGLGIRLTLVSGTFVALWFYGKSLVERAGPAPAHLKDLLRIITSTVSLPIPKAMLLVPAMFVGAGTARDWSTALISSAGLVVVGVALFFLAAMLNVSFEEASIATSLRREQRRERRRGGQRGERSVLFRTPALFPLRESGRPEVAVVWKNVIALARTSAAFVVVFLVIYLTLLGVALWSHDAGTNQAIGGMMMMLAALFPFFGPQVFANDFRLDLRRAEVLKSYPLSGDRLVAAEIAAPLVVIALFEMAFIASGSLLWSLSSAPRGIVAIIGTPQFVISAMLFAIPVCTIQLLIRNAMPLYFPAWTMQPKDETRGIATTGQRLIVLAANVTMLTVVLIPAALVFLPSFWVAHHYFPGSPVGLAVATMPAIGVMVVEIVMALQALGARFERFDVWNELDSGV